MSDIARELLHAKLALEAELLRPLDAFATRYVADLEETGGAIGAHDRLRHAEQLESILRRHYARVVMVVTGRRPPRDPSLQQAALSLLHLESLSGRAKDNAALILNSLDREFARAVATLSNAPAPDQGLENYESKADSITAGYIGKIKAAASAVLKKFKSKLSGVSNVNTNGVAEEARSIQVVPDAEANGYIEQEWHNVGDERVRGNPAGIYASSKFDHWSCEGQVRRVSEPFDISGEALRFPGDGKNGSLGNIINCFPADTLVSGDVVGATKHLYSGDVVEITTRKGHKLTATPNHPILTPEGWVAAGRLTEGSYVVCGRFGGYGELPTATPAPQAHDVDHVEPRIEQVFDTLARGGVVVRENGLAVDFHGDMPDSDVHIVRADRVLKVGFETPAREQVREGAFTGSDLTLRGLFGGRLSGQLVGAYDADAPRDVGFANESLPRFWAGLSHSYNHRFASTPNGDAVSLQDFADRKPGNSELVGERFFGCSGEIATDDIALIERRQFNGHVFNLQTTQGLYYANGICVHNCRCYLTTYFVHGDGRRELIHTGPSAPTRSYAKRPAPGAPKLNPTSLVTLNGATRARVVLSDGSLATLRQQSPNLITVSINGKPIARAVISKTRSVRVTVDPKFRGRGIEDLIRRSVRHSDQMDRTPHAERVR